MLKTQKRIDVYEIIYFGFVCPEDYFNLPDHFQGAEIVYVGYMSDEWKVRYASAQLNQEVICMGYVLQHPDPVTQRRLRREFYTFSFDYESVEYYYRFPLGPLLFKIKEPCTEARRRILLEKAYRSAKERSARKPRR